jgi:hypothetical protein
MSAPGDRSHERRENLAELHSPLRSRLLGLEEPVDRSDWGAVVERSRGYRMSRHRSFAIVAGAAAVLSLALTASLLLLPGSRHPTPEAAPLRLALHLADGRGLVLYSVAKRARFLDSSAEQRSPRTTAIVRSLSGGPFHVRAALIHTAGGRLRGDEALVSFRLFTTSGLERAAGSAVLTCQYGFDRTAYCDGAVDLQDGMRLTASGTLNAAGVGSLVATGGYSADSSRSDHTAREPRYGTRRVAAAGGV